MTGFWRSDGELVDRLVVVGLGVGEGTVTIAPVELVLDSSPGKRSETDRRSLPMCSRWFLETRMSDRGPTARTVTRWGAVIDPVNDALVLAGSCEVGRAEAAMERLPGIPRPLGATIAICPHP